MHQIMVIQYFENMEQGGGFAPLACNGVRLIRAFLRFYITLSYKLYSNALHDLNISLSFGSQVYQTTFSFSLFIGLALLNDGTSYIHN